MITEKINKLLNEEVPLKEKIKIVTFLNKHRYDGHVLAEVANIFLAKAVKVQIDNMPSNTIDIVGTGGDGYSTLNYSTLSALMLAKMGVPVIKHGNRAVTSKCGSFDFLELIGIELPTTPQEAIDTFKEHHRVFLFAPYFHPIFKEVAPVRAHFAEIGEKTIFNILGPLLNPARVKRMLVGVYEEALVEPMAIALSELGVEYGYVVYGAGMDEFSTCGINHVIEICNTTLTKQSIHPEQLGFKRIKPELLKAGDAHHNVKESIEIINGELMGPKRDMLVLNAAAALTISTGFKQDISESINQIETFLSAKPVLFPHPVMN